MNRVRRRWTVARGFDRLAPIYDVAGDLLFLGGLRRHARKTLRQAEAGEHALIAGGGTGRFLVDLLDGGYTGAVTYCDLSPQMLRRAKSKISGRSLNNRILFFEGEISDLSTEVIYDRIFAHFFLDLFQSEELERVIEGLTRRAAPGARLSVAEFRGDDSGAASWARDLMVSGMYSFFRWSCSVTAKRLADFDSALTNAGWTREGKWQTALFERSEWIAPVDH